MTSVERTPYLKCLIHETKKVYKPWLIFVSAIGAAIGLGYVVWAAQGEILRIFEQIGNFFGSIQNTLALVPWWLWIVIGIFIAPVIYAAVKCLWIRKKSQLTRISSNACVFVFTICVIGGSVLSIFGEVSGIALGVVLGLILIGFGCVGGIKPWMTLH